MNAQPQRLLRSCAFAVLACLTACGFGTVKDPAADRVSADLSQLEADPQLAGRAPHALKEAQDAVAAAEVPQKDPALSAHLVYLADRKVQTARALAEAHVAEDQLKLLHSP
jgi:hypothetical protein